MASPEEPHPWIRGALILLLPILASGIWVKGQQYDPEVLDLSRSGASVRDTSWIPDKLPPLSRLGPLRQFTRENLSDYVNGHAEFYLNAGFKGLVVAEYAPEGEQRSPQVTIDIFDMGEPLHAFGTLMNETPANVKSLAVGAMGFDLGQGINFIQGGLFIKMTAFVPDLPLAAWAGQWAEQLRKKTGPADLVIGFPALGTVVETRFIKENYHGLAFFDHVLERTFKRDDTLFQSFLMTGTPEELRQRKQALLDFLAKEQIPTTVVQEGSIPHLLIRDPYEGDWFLVEHKNQLLGVFGMAPGSLEQPLKEFLKP
ncbi:MAG: hypothetical protein HQL84_16875 [Magnetococcales bacterium]|nr:hypothetical protein [Magnetococcales bacterium]MBF0151695.1 hypothetical protein [Magnetococcales bacterium]MBF0347704.1 hypothetical protein [Magnetococcales bacterium]